MGTGGSAQGQEQHGAWHAEAALRAWAMVAFRVEASCRLMGGAASAASMAACCAATWRCTPSLTCAAAGRRGRLSAAAWLLATLSGGVAGLAGRPGSTDIPSASWEMGVGFDVLVDLEDLYSLPRHHITSLDEALFAGSGSQKYCTIRLYRPKSTVSIAIAYYEYDAGG